MLLITTKPNIETAIQLCAENTLFSVGIAYTTEHQRARVIVYIHSFLRKHYPDLQCKKIEIEGQYSVCFENGSKMRIFPVLDNSRGCRYNALLVPADVNWETLRVALLPCLMHYFTFMERG